VKPEPILSGLEAVGAGGQGPQWAMEPVEEEEEYHNRGQWNMQNRKIIRVGKFIHVFKIRYIFLFHFCYFLNR
jgi:hypothetical protein